MTDLDKEKDKKKDVEETPGAAGGLDDDDVWGDVEDPMAEIEGLTDTQIEAQIKEMESQIRRERNDFTNAKKQTEDLQKRIKENREKLKMST